MVPFAGYWMAVQYRSIVAEHLHTRQRAALFDVSHMGQATLGGEGRAKALEALVPGDIQALSAGRVRYTLLTNAAGGIRADLVPGTLMVIDDHINAMGVHPLVGPYNPCWGTRFPDQTQVYDADLRQQIDCAAERLGQPLAHGVYLAASGPTYETPAGIRAFRTWGADAVGMSTVPEAMLAHAAGLRVGNHRGFFYHLAPPPYPPITSPERPHAVDRVFEILGLIGIGGVCREPEFHLR